MRLATVYFQTFILEIEHADAVSRNVLSLFSLLCSENVLKIEQERLPRISYVLYRMFVVGALLCELATYRNLPYISFKLLLIAINLLVTRVFMAFSAFSFSAGGF